MAEYVHGCDSDAGVVSATPATAAVASAAPAAVRVPAGIADDLAGNESLPRIFAFEPLNFDTGRSDVRAADRQELMAISQALARHADARIRVVGYADARGADVANAALGKARADSVQPALVEAGIDADRIETASGGEADPVDSNATLAGQAENRRTELVVLQR